MKNGDNDSLMIKITLEVLGDKDDEDAGALKPTLAMLNAKKNLKRGVNLAGVRV